MKSIKQSLNTQTQEWQRSHGVHGTVRHLVAVGLYALLSVVATWPTVLGFTTNALGELYSDRVQNIWNTWWVKFALLDLHTHPFETHHLLYPGGADLYFHALNLPSAIVSLPLCLAFGPIAAYNFTALLGLTLSGYAGFRLAFYLWGDYRAALVGGLIIGFNPLSLEMLRGQVNIVNIEWFLLAIEFYLRAWSSRRRSDAVLLGVFFALALLTVGYFEVLLLVFFGVHSIWALVANTTDTAGITVDWQVRLRNWGKRIAHVAIWGGAAALLLLSPYLVGAWRSSEKGQVLIRSGLDDTRTVAQSADLISFILPSKEHWLLGAGAPWRGLIRDNVPDFTNLGVIMVSLAVIGVWRRRKEALIRLWLSTALIGAVLALGPVLKVNGHQSLGGVSVSLPFQWIQGVLPFSLVRAPERFIFLTYVSLGVLASIGALSILGQARRRDMLLAAISVLLLVEMPLHVRYVTAMPVPQSVSVLKRDPAPGAVLELPMTHHGRIEVRQMYYQTVHGRPITSAYLSRVTLDPYIQVCSPLKVFRDYPDIGANDIISPTTATELSPRLLASFGIGFIVVYKQVFRDVGQLQLSPVREGELSTLQELAGRLGNAIADDDVATVYKVRPSQGFASPLLQLGDGWHQLEESQGKPFRWINGKESDVCVFTPRPTIQATMPPGNQRETELRTGTGIDPQQAAFKASLGIRATSFHKPRRLQVWIGESKVMEVEVPADGILHDYSTPVVMWPDAAQVVRFVVPDGSGSPADVNNGDPDRRQLSIGFGLIAMQRSQP